MPTKSAQAPRRPLDKKKEDPVEIVVRRGATRRFNALKTKTSALPVVVAWDRREADRRALVQRSAHVEVPRNRRASDRRQAPPFTWELADFVVVAPPPGIRKTARKQKPKKA
jgi:hypothetical protein